MTTEIAAVKPLAEIKPLAETEPLVEPIALVVAKPLAIVAGQPYVKKPNDLFIPPAALEVFLQAFEGPLDLLLYLIRKHKFDIVDLPIFQITEQYMEYVDVMKELDLDLAAEYLLMAAILAEIKSRMLLPTETVIEEEEDDPRAMLIERLKEYERYKQAAFDLDDLPRLERDYQFARVALADNLAPVVLPAEVELNQLFNAFSAVLKRIDSTSHHQIEREKLSTRERMTKIMTFLEGKQRVVFHRLFELREGKSGLVVTFIAILELAKEQLIGWELTSDHQQLIVFKRYESNEL